VPTRPPTYTTPNVMSVHCPLPLLRPSPDREGDITHTDTPHPLTLAPSKLQLCIYYRIYSMIAASKQKAVKQLCGVSMCACLSRMTSLIARTARDSGDCKQWRRLRGNRGDRPLQKIRWRRGTEALLSPPIFRKCNYKLMH